MGLRSRRARPSRRTAASAAPPVEVAAVVVPLVWLSAPPAHAATSAEAPATPASWNIRRRERTLQIMGQAEVVFMSLLHDLHSAARCYESAMRFL